MNLKRPTYRSASRQGAIYIFAMGTALIVSVLGLAALTARGLHETAQDETFSRNLATSRVLTFK